MEDNLSEVSIERIFEKYIPGEDPKASLLENCHYQSGAYTANNDTAGDNGVLNSTLYKLADSVVARARSFITVDIQDISCRQLEVDGEDDELEASKNGAPTHCAIYFNSDDARGDIVTLVETTDSHSHCAFEFKKTEIRFTREHRTRGKRALKQFAEHIAHVLARQHRTHVLALYVFRDQARVCYFDRSGGVVSNPFHYGTKDNMTLQRFFYRLARMTREQLGFDPTATVASQEVVDALRSWAITISSEYLQEQVYHALCWDPKSGLFLPEAEEWPMHEIVFKKKTLYIGKPMFSSKSLFGRGTRGYVAIEKEGAGDGGSTSYALRFLKDSWRFAEPNARPEHEVYERLASRGVSEYVPTCLGGEDVLKECGTVWQKTKTWAAVQDTPRGHYRLLLKEVCRPLDDFYDFADLALVLGDALAAHRDAWVKAEILHRDISHNNILIYDTKDENGDDIRVGLLADWELSKYKENMVTGPGPTKPHHAGTWAFRSALSQQYPTKPYAVSDDIESFVHVFHYCVLRFHKTGYDGVLPDIISMTYQHRKTRTADGAQVGCAVKFGHMHSPFPAILPEDNPTLHAMLEDLATTCAAHYATINMAEYDRLYSPPALPEKMPPKPVEEKPAPLPTRPLRRKLNAVPSNAVLQPVVPPQPTLQDHVELSDIFQQWGLWKWPACDLKRSCEDLVKRDELELNNQRRRFGYP